MLFSCHILLGLCIFIFELLRHLLHHPLLFISGFVFESLVLFVISSTVFHFHFRVQTKLWSKQPTLHTYLTYVIQMVYRKSIVIPRIPTVVKLNESCCLICSCDNGPGGIDVEEYTMTLKLHSIATFESYFFLPHENLLAYYLNSLSLSCRFAWRRRTSHMLVKYMLANVSKICSFSSQLGIWTGIKGRYHLPSLSVSNQIWGTSPWNIDLASPEE